MEPPVARPQRGNRRKVNTMDEHQKAVRAQERVYEITGFYIHLAVFVVVIAVLFFINMTADPNDWWVQWVVLGWGIGVLTHALAVFGRLPKMFVEWQLRKIKEIKDSM
jgi:hypothetical protein